MRLPSDGRGGWPVNGASATHTALVVHVGIHCYTVRMSSSAAPLSDHAGNHHLAASTLERLPAAEELTLIGEAQAGPEKATAALLEAYQPLLAGHARHVPKIGLEAEDLLQAGRLGMLEAIRGFDPERGTRLSTPAGWWVRWELQKASASALPMPVPEKEHRLQGKVQAVALRLLAERGDQPDATEVALASGLPVSAVRCRLSGSPTMLSLDELDADQLPVGATGQDGPDERPDIGDVRTGVATLAARLTRRLGRTPHPGEVSAALRGEGVALSHLALGLAELTASCAVPACDVMARAA